LPPELLPAVTRCTRGAGLCSFSFELEELRTELAVIFPPRHRRRTKDFSLGSSFGEVESGHEIEAWRSPRRSWLRAAGTCNRPSGPMFYATSAGVGSLSLDSIQLSRSVRLYRTSFSPARKWRGPSPRERHKRNAASLTPMYFAACSGVSVVCCSVTLLLPSWPLYARHSVY